MGDGDGGPGSAAPQPSSASVAAGAAAAEMGGVDAGAGAEETEGSFVLLVLEGSITAEYGLEKQEQRGRKREPREGSASPDGDGRGGDGGDRRGKPMRKVRPRRRKDRVLRKGTLYYTAGVYARCESRRRARCGVGVERRWGSVRLWSGCGCFCGVLFGKRSAPNKHDVFLFASFGRFVRSTAV